MPLAAWASKRREDLRFIRVYHSARLIGPGEGDRHVFPGTTVDNLLTERCASREFAGKMSQSPAPVD